MSMTCINISSRFCKGSWQWLIHCITLSTVWVYIWSTQRSGNCIYFYKELHYKKCSVMTQNIEYGTTERQNKLILLQDHSWKAIGCLASHCSPVTLAVIQMWHLWTMHFCYTLFPNCLPSTRKYGVKLWHWSAPLAHNGHNNKQLKLWTWSDIIGTSICYTWPAHDISM
jgi:hypothetical protein